MGYYMVELECEFDHPFAMDGAQVSGAIFVTELEVPDQDELLPRIAGILEQAKAKVIHPFTVIELKMTSIACPAEILFRTVYY